jgi:hypothetical protein
MTLRDLWHRFGFWACLVGAFVLMMWVTTCSHAADCLRQSEVAGRHLTWSGRVAGHRGEHCWFPDRAARRAADQSKHVRSRTPRGAPYETLSRGTGKGSTPSASTDTLTAFDRAIPSASAAYAMTVTIAVWDWRPPDWTSGFSELVERAHDREKPH